MGVKLVSSGGGSVEINPPATASNFVATMPAGTGTVAVNGVSSNIVMGAAVASTSGTSIDFTGIPSWVRRVTVMFSGVSTNGTSPYLIQLGDAGGIENTGYTSSGKYFASSSLTTATSTAGFIVGNTTAAASSYFGHFTINLVSANAWTAFGALTESGNSVNMGVGGKTLSDTLDRVRITTVNGTDTFDAGSINIMYE